MLREIGGISNQMLGPNPYANSETKWDESYVSVVLPWLNTPLHPLARVNGALFLSWVMGREKFDAVQKQEKY